MENLDYKNEIIICNKKRKPSEVTVINDEFKDLSYPNSNKHFRLDDDNLLSKGSCSIAPVEPHSLIPVLSDEYYNDIPTVLMYIGKITNKKEASRILKEICHLWPLEKMQHLKRAKVSQEQGVLDVIIRPVDMDEKAIEKNITLSDVIRNVTFSTKGLSECIHTASIPKFSPLTTLQYQQCMTLWPVQYREDKYIESIINNTLFSTDDMHNHQKFMSIAVDAAKHSKLQVGAVIVDPPSKKVIAVAYDRRDIHPLQHAVMVAIDLVAKSQGGGAWNITEDEVLFALSSNVESNSDEKTNSKKSLPYICTSYDLYVTREPCVMCAMALVHSRIRRVFYGNSSSCGGLGSRYKIHVQPGLNHHYEVWKGLLRNDCSNLQDENYILKESTSAKS